MDAIGTRCGDVRISSLFLESFVYDRIRKFYVVIVGFVKIHVFNNIVPFAALASATTVRSYFHTAVDYRSHVNNNER